MVLVNSNEAKRDNVDSFTEMQKHSENQKYDAPYVMDRDSKLAMLLEPVLLHMYF